MNRILLTKELGFLPSDITFRKTEDIERRIKGLSNFDLLRTAHAIWMDAHEFDLESSAYIYLKISDEKDFRSKVNRDRKKISQFRPEVSLSILSGIRGDAEKLRWTILVSFNLVSVFMQHTITVAELLLPTNSSGSEDLLKKIQLLKGKATDFYGNQNFINRPVFRSVHDFEKQAVNAIGILQLQKLSVPTEGFDDPLS